MARAKRGIQARPRRVTTAQRSRRFEDNQLKAPTIDWSSPPEQFRFPEISELVNMTPEELTYYLERFGIKEAWPQMRASTAGYVQRMTSMPPGSPAFMDEINRLLDAESKRGALSMTRRAYRELATIDALDGDVATELIWITDGDDGTCPHCESRGGDIGTIQYHAAKGLPGPGVCLGGDMCRCQLLPIL